MRYLNITAFFLILFLASCTNTDPLDSNSWNGKIDEQDVQSRSLNSDRILQSAPEDRNGRLYFSNSRQYSDFMNLLNTQIFEDSDFEDNVLQTLSFPSLTYLMENDRFNNPSKRFTPCLGTIAQSLILNKHYEVQVGDVVFSFLTTEYVAAVAHDDFETLEHLRGENRCEMNLVKVENKLDFALIKDEDIIEFRFSPCKAKLFIDARGCDSILVHGSMNNWIGAGNGVLTIEAFDFEEDVTGTFSFVFAIDLIGGIGTIEEIEAILNPDCFINDDLIETISFGESTCDALERDTGWQWAENGNYAFSYRLYNKHNSIKDKEFAQLYSYARSNINDDWDQYRVDQLGIDLTTMRRALCQELQVDTDFEDCNNCKKLKAKTSANPNQVSSDPNQNVEGILVTDFCDGDVTAVFNIVDFSNNLSHEDGIPFTCCIN